MGLKLYQWYDELIVAEDEADVRKCLKEQRDYDGRTLRHQPIERVFGAQEMCNTSNQDITSNYRPSEIVKMFGRGVVPSIR
jgi:hypothetical protein